jgi:hypothetical protein
MNLLMSAAETLMFAPDGTIAFGGSVMGVKLGSIWRIVILSVGVGLERTFTEGFVPVTVVVLGKLLSDWIKGRFTRPAPHELPVLFFVR